MPKKVREVISTVVLASLFSWAVVRSSIWVFHHWSEWHGQGGFFP